MAAGYLIDGPTQIKIGAGVLGVAHDDDLGEYDIEHHQRIARCSLTGDEPAEVIYVGMTAIVQFTVPFWDRAIAAPLILSGMGATGTGADRDGRAGVIGTRMVADQAHYSIVFQPITTGRLMRTFHRCYTTDARVLDFGNEPEKLFVTAVAIRNGASASAIGDGASATAQVWTTATTSA